MFRNTIVNTINYFYPLGNTPASCLTQDLPPGKDADLLLLGCGDARNVLFTCFTDPQRKLDVTCCDVEPAIIARNILLYTLLIDDTQDERPQQIWNVYYHWKIDDRSWELLTSQADRLLALSETATTWRTSSYGNIIRFCDEQTVVKIRRFWLGCSSRKSATAHCSQDGDPLQDNITRAQRMRREIIGGGYSLAGVRSAAPTGMSVLEDLSHITSTWWEHGVTTLDTESELHSRRLNPAFLASLDQRLVLHYGSEPLLGFPLATAYVPLLGGHCLHAANRGLPSSRYLAACAFQHFRAWACAFRDAASKGITIRSCVADALTLSLTLRAATYSDGNVLTANVSRDSWTCQALVLDEVEYTTSSRTAPRQFDIVDTSNLIDHLGPLNIIPTCASLLKSESWSTMYTEILVQQDSSERERVAGLLGANLQAVALLLGLSPCETWTNATNAAEDDAILDTLRARTRGNGADSSNQTRSRLRWKRNFSPNQDNSSPPLYIDASQAARLLAKVHDHMFDHENVASLLAGLGKNAVLKRPHPYYNRASFVMLLWHMQKTVHTDWSQCLEEMIARIFTSFSHSPTGPNSVQELFHFMHMFGIDTTRLPPAELDVNRNERMTKFFGLWPDVPAHVCVTLRIPNQRLQVFTSRPIGSAGTPALRCDIDGRGAQSDSWSNTFTCVSVAFGHASLSYHQGVPALQIDEDDSTWWGSSDMFLSAFVPTWMLLQPCDVTPTVRCGLVSTPQSCRLYVEDLGIALNLFSADLVSEDVVVSRYMPGMSGLPSPTWKEACPPPLSQRSLSVALSSTDAAIQCLTYRISYKSKPEQAKLADRSHTIQVRFKDAWSASIQVGSDPKSCVSFPIPVDHLRHRVRIARTSSYVEIETPPWDPLTETSLCLLFPTVPPGRATHPVSWTATYVKLDVLPVVDTKQGRSMQWLITHASMMFSTQERQIRERGLANDNTTETAPNLRVEIKDGLFSMLMAFSGAQGNRANVFGLSKNTDGVHILILVSCMRLDLLNRTVVLDAAVVPLTHEMHSDSKVKSFYHSLTASGVMQIKVSSDELRCWKTFLPALTERCRLWEHTPKCEYASTRESPNQKGLEDGHSPLCSCGIGRFPTFYLRDMNHNAAQHVLKRYATRVAISPLFAVPYVEDCFLAGVSLPTLPLPIIPGGTGCGHCGSNQRKGADAVGAKLLVCARCRKTSYCSTECQRANWKEHKRSCTKS